MAQVKCFNVVINDRQKAWTSCDYKEFWKLRILLFEDYDDWRLRWSKITRIKNNDDDDNVITVNNRDGGKISFKIE